MKLDFVPALTWKSANVNPEYADEVTLRRAIEGRRKI